MMEDEMTGKELIEAAAKRAVETCEQMAEDNNHAPFAELVEAAQRHREQCLCTCDECIGLHESLAEVEKIGEKS